LKGPEYFRAFPFFQAPKGGHLQNPSIVKTSQKVKKRLSARRGRVPPPPPLEVNSNGSTLTPARRLIALGLLMMDILRVHQL
jgi:hypothetical protein